MLMFVALHIYLLHRTSSTSASGRHDSFGLVRFAPYYLHKDGMGLLVFGYFIVFLLYNPWALGDPENIMAAKPMSSPVHIQPE
jgi:quinol-cytochrome oxidoreductase complex cytochrome b subunit